MKALKLLVILAILASGLAMFGQSVVKTAMAQGGTCEGLNDYQLQGLTELSSHDYFLHVQFYRWDGDPERETLLPSGRYPLLVNTLRGHVWELGPDCTAQQALDRHVGPSIARRQEMGANNGGYVHWTKLITESLISVGWQKQPVPVVSTAIGAATSTPAAPATAVPASTPTLAAACLGIREDHRPQVGQTWTPKGNWRVVNFWTNEVGKSQEERKLLLKPWEDPALLGGGSSWSWPSNCEAVAKGEYTKNGRPEVTLNQLKATGLVW